MTAWQRINGPRNKREMRVAKIARDIERKSIIAILSDHARELEQCPCDDNCTIVRAGILLAIGDIEYMERNDDASE